MEEDVKTIAVADPSKQESLVTEAEVDPMDAEQTWPTDEELKQAEGLQEHSFFAVENFFYFIARH